MTKAVFAGTFDPFTSGHLSIVERAAKIFDEVVILFADNLNKKRSFDSKDMREAVNATIKRYGYQNVTVDSTTGFVVDYCKDHGIEYLVRGVRNQTDFAYEEKIAATNKILDSTIETIYLRAEDAAISSSMVRTLLSAKRDILPYVPYEVYDLITFCY